jgi:uncharacterized protein YbjQ (UPF0145 family)
VGSQWSLSRVTAGPRKQIYGPRMSEWDGRGLPPAAAARMARFRADGVRTSLLDVPDMAAVSGVGLPPVGEVMGCMVEHIGWQGFGGCRLYGPGAGWAASWGTTVTSGQGARFAGYKPYVDALYRGYDTALARMLTEAQAMGADGVVGVRLSVNHLGQDNREFVALGTAVRAAGDVHAPRPFVTDLPGARATSPRSRCRRSSCPTARSCWTGRSRLPASSMVSPRTTCRCMPDSSSTFASPSLATTDR